MNYFKAGVVGLLVVTFGGVWLLDEMNPPKAGVTAQPSGNQQTQDQNAVVADMAAGIITKEQSLAPTGPGDPYAAGQQSMALSEYEVDKRNLLARVRTAASAARCRVIAEVEMEVIGSDGINTISRNEINAGLSDYHPDLLPAVRSVEQDSYKEAGQPGGCDFWMQHPEAVAEMRKQAALATSGP